MFDREKKSEIAAPQPVTSSTFLILRNVASSIVAGTAISYTTFPLEGYKKYLQSKQGTKFFPFRGANVFAANIVPTNTVQWLTNQGLKQVMPQSHSLALGWLASFTCGVTGAITATFVENTIIRQQVLKTGPIHAIKDMLAVSPLRPWKSYLGISARDGIFTLCMMNVAPNAVRFAQEKFGLSPFVQGAAFCTATFIGAATSHPVDTIATNLQKSHEKKSYATVAREIYQEDGIKGFYRGFMFRLGLFTAFAAGLPYVKGLAEQAIDSVIVNKAKP